jgi:RimJ/RimL family protein N-acetyltransferase
VADALPRVGDGFVLRRLRGSDLRAFQAYRGDPVLGRYQGWSPMPDDAAQAFLADMSSAPLLQPGEWLQLGIADATGERLIGDIGLCLAAAGDEVEVGFTLSRPAQGRGIATAAVRAALALVFAHSPAARATAITDARNTASIRLLERLGMQRVDSRTAVFRGEACVEHVYGLRRPAAGERRLRRATLADHAALLALWEASVRATHDFFTAADIDALRPSVAAALSSPALTVWVLTDAHDEPLGWLGQAGERIEALFLGPQARGQGGGRALVAQAQAAHGGGLQVDVNEQNPQALGFYERLGFCVIGRSAVDAEGRPFPLLHLARPAPS